MFSEETNEDLDNEPTVERLHNAGLKPPQQNAREVLAEVALNAALDRRRLKLMLADTRITILQVPSADWVAPIGKAVKRLSAKPAVEEETERRRLAGAITRVGAGGLDWLQEGRSLVYVCRDPTEILDEAVLAAADQTIVVPPLTSALLSKVIRRVTGGVVRGVTEQMARLDFSVIAAVVRPTLSARECVACLQRAVDRSSVQRDTNGVPLLPTLPLTRPMRIWTDQMLADLKEVEAGRMSPDQLVFAVLMGPPGTGKSLIAEALAKTADWSFVPSSVGTWFTSGDGALGGVARNVRSFVDQVLASEPAIGFLDELDAIPNRDALDGKERSWWTPVITLFLTEIDRLRKSGKRIMLIGATNHYEHLDPALIRPGRMQQKVPVLPVETEDEVIAVLRYYLGDEYAGADIARLGQFGRGATPAAIEGWVKEARAVARAEHRSLTEADLLAQIVPEDARNAGDIRAAAIHEIGHALVALRLGLDVNGVSIVAQGTAGGLTMTRMRSLVPTWEELTDMVTVALAGRAADIVLGKGAHAGAENDLAIATDMLRAAFERQGLGKDLGYVPESRAPTVDLRKAVEEQLQKLLQRAISIVEADRVLALALVDRLVVEKLLSGAEILKALGETSGRLPKGQKMGQEEGKFWPGNL